MHTKKITHYNLLLTYKMRNFHLRPSYDVLFNTFEIVKINISLDIN